MSLVDENVYTDAQSSDNLAGNIAEDRPHAKDQHHAQLLGPRVSIQGILSPETGFPHQTRNLVLCAFLYAVYIGLRSGILEVAPLASQEIFRLSGQDPRWYEPVTLPFASIFVSDVLLAFPNAKMMERFGRRRSFMFGGAMAALGCLFAGLTLMLAERGGATHVGSYWLLSLSGLVIGPFSMAEFVRFAAAEAVPRDQQARALGLVVSGGAVCSIVGPVVASLTSFFARQAGSELRGYAYFYFVGIFAALAYSCGAAGLRLPEEADRVAGHCPTTRPAPPPREIFARPGIQAAFIGSFGSQWYMVLLMAASPLVMQKQLGLQGADWRISSCVAAHLLGMFVPGFFSGAVHAKRGTRSMLTIGWVISTMAIAVGLLPVFLGIEGNLLLLVFYATLVTLGIGWHFAFVGSSKLLLENQHGDSEKVAVQGANEFCRFFSNTVAILLAGSLSWGNSNIVAAPVLVLMIMAMIFLLRQKRPARDPTAPVST